MVIIITIIFIYSNEIYLKCILFTPSLYKKKLFLKLNFLQKLRILHYSKKDPEMKWAFLKFEKPHCHLIETKNIIRIRTKIEYFN